MGSLRPKRAVDAVGVTQRAEVLAGRSIKGALQPQWLRLAISCADLTSLEGSDTPGRIRSLARKALNPDPTGPEPLPSVAAVCVYPTLVPAALEVLSGSSVAVASVAGAFPSGLSHPHVVVEDVRRAVEFGADELDIVLDRSRFLAGDVVGARDLLREQIAAAQGRPVKVILETGELGSLETIARAAEIALEAGASFIKTSTGKIPQGANYPTVLVMAHVLRDYFHETGQRRGLKVSGGVRSARQAMAYLSIIHETLGDEWLTPELFRIGASTLLDDLARQVRTCALGSYASFDHIPQG